MGNNPSNYYSKFNQELNNEIYQSLSTSCIARCEQNIGNVDIIIVDSKLKGGIRFDQICSAYASCTLPTSLETNAQEIITETSRAAANVANSFLSYTPTADETELSFGSRIRNSLTQIIDSSCNANVRQSLNNVLIYAVNSEIEKDIEFSQSGTASATCSMNNAGKINLYSQNSANLQNTERSYSFTAVILLFLGFMVVLVILGVVGYIVYKKA